MLIFILVGLADRFDFHFRLSATNFRPEAVLHPKTLDLQEPFAHSWVLGDLPNDKNHLKILPSTC